MSNNRPHQKRKASAPSGPIASVLGLFHLQRQQQQQQQQQASPGDSPKERKAMFHFPADSAAGAGFDEDDDDASDDDEESARSSESSAGGAAAAAALRPKRDIQRCHSAVDSSDPPAHALFLQQQCPRSSQHEIDLGVAVYDGDEAAESQKKKKSITEKFSFLSRKSIDSSQLLRRDAGEKSVRGIRPNHDQLLRWSNSFDSLLGDKYGLALFRAFLKTEYSDENIEFWVACEEYRGLSGQKKQALKAQKIYNEFVAFQAPREVNLDSTTRLATINAMGSADKHLFELAQKRIQALMEKDSYQRFLRSDVYQNHVRDALGAGKS